VAEAALGLVAAAAVALLLAAAALEPVAAAAVPQWCPEVAAAEAVSQPAACGQAPARSSAVLCPAAAVP
jgi:hypothetical protein